VSAEVGDSRYQFDNYKQPLQTKHTTVTDINATVEVVHGCHSLLYTSSVSLNGKIMQLEPVTLQDNNHVFTAGQNRLGIKTRNCK